MIATEHFNMSEDGHRVTPPIEGTALIGMVVGFGSTFVFFVIAAILIISDEIKRHKDYAAQIERDLKRFDEFYYDDQQRAGLEKEFMEAEAKRGVRVDARAAAQELSAIN